MKQANKNENEIKKYKNKNYKKKNVETEWWQTFFFLSCENNNKKNI